MNIDTILSDLGIKELNPMQIAAKEAFRTEINTLLLSPTGSGKTLGFLLPILSLLNPNIKEVQCLIIVPSRELALQIEQVWKKMNTPYKVNSCYGGHNVSTEINNLSSPPAVLIGTPGRIEDHFNRKTFDFRNIEVLVLDEFDKSLTLGFQEQMQTIIKRLPKIKKRFLVSATPLHEIPDFVGIKQIKTLNFLPKEPVNNQLELKHVFSKTSDTFDALFELLCSLNSESAIVFCNFREVCEHLVEDLNNKGLEAIFYHGGMDQDDRERALIKFRNGSSRYLITTDLAARGLDIPEMNHVVHFQLPSKEAEFIHRNGRTARMNASGKAYVITDSKANLPDYVKTNLPEFKIQYPLQLPKPPDFSTLYISGGKKNKLNKIDIVGFFLQIGKLAKEDLGIIEVKDFQSFVAIRTSKLKGLLNNIEGQKMKGKKYKIELESRKVYLD